MVRQKAPIGITTKESSLKSKTSVSPFTVAEFSIKTVNESLSTQHFTSKPLIKFCYSQISLQLQLDVLRDSIQPNTDFRGHILPLETITMVLKLH